MYASSTASRSAEATCQNCSLTSLCLPRGLTPAEVEVISRIVARRKTLHRGEYIFRDGDPFQGLVAIKSGTAKTVAIDGHGRELITALLLPGELLGFDALATNRHRCSAIALETVSFCELPGDRLDDLCRQVPGLLRELFRHVGSRLANETTHAIAVKQPAEERVAGLLLNISERLESRGFSAVVFRLRLTRQEIGNYLGLALETVSRILHAFQTAGLIEIHNKDVRILDRQALQAICNSRD